MPMTIQRAEAKKRRGKRRGGKEMTRSMREEGGRKDKEKERTDKILERYPEVLSSWYVNGAQWHIDVYNLYTWYINEI